MSLFFLPFFPFLLQWVLVSLVVHLYLKIQSLLLQAWFPKSLGSQMLEVKRRMLPEGEKNIRLSLQEILDFRVMKLKSHHFWAGVLGNGVWPSYTGGLGSCD